MGKKRNRKYFNLDKDANGEYNHTGSVMLTQQEPAISYRSKNSAATRK
jgi:hypothetical protein